MADIYEQRTHCGLPTRPVDLSRCRARVYDGTTRNSYQCQRKPKVEIDGIGYCGQHDPAAKKARQQVSDERYAKQMRRAMMGGYGEGFMAALIKIRDGDNDPRETARQALKNCRYAD